MASRMLVVGLDGLSPELVARWRGDLPTLDALMRAGIHGRLHSTVPAVTPPAWTAAMTGVNPGRFGFHDFLVRAGHEYADFRLVASTDQRAPGVDQLVAAAGGRACRVAVPVGYPPPELERGAVVACFFAPTSGHRLTFPPALQRELEVVAGPYMIDATGPNGTAEERDRLLRTIVEMDAQRFRMTRHLLRTRQWDLLWMVALGTDRVAHYFFRDLDLAHPDHDAGSAWRDAVLQCYRACDRHLGELLDQAGDIPVLVLSDHGTQRIEGKVCLNEWLRDRGYLHCDPPAAPCSPREAPIRWGQTRAWAHGSGGAIYLNVVGREPQGVVAPERYDAEVAALTEALLDLTTPDGRKLHVDVIERRYVYDGPYADNAPDLFVNVEDQRWLVSDQVGTDTVFVDRNFGRDGACHAMTGFFALAGPGVRSGGDVPYACLYDIAPTILALLGLEIPADCEGRSLLPPASSPAVNAADDAMSRLRALYLS